MKSDVWLKKTKMVLRIGGLTRNYLLLYPASDFVIFCEKIIVINFLSVKYVMINNI